MKKEMRRSWVRWGLYPASWGWVMLSLAVVLQIDADERPAWILITLPLLLVYLIIEAILPLQQRWSMSRSNLPADFAYIIISGVSVGLATTALAMASISLAEGGVGLAARWPLWLEVPVLFLVFEFLNYHLHRAMHELPGRAGRWLWRVHAVHHLPDRLYLLMHAVLHPLNSVGVQTLAIILPIWAMGYSPEAVLIFLVTNAFHGLISHFNADVRLGWANYLFVGPETHRYHHSACLAEAKNFGATLTIWDQVFGTFVYHPNRVPEALGTEEGVVLANYREIGRALCLPFRRA